MEDFTSYDFDKLSKVIYPLIEYFEKQQVQITEIFQKTFKPILMELSEKIGKIQLDYSEALADTIKSISDGIRSIQININYPKLISTINSIPTDEEGTIELELDRSDKEIANQIVPGKTIENKVKLSPEILIAIITLLITILIQLHNDCSDRQNQEQDDRLLNAIEENTESMNQLSEYKKQITQLLESINDHLSDENSQEASQ